MTEKKKKILAGICAVIICLVLIIGIACLNYYNRFKLVSDTINLELGTKLDENTGKYVVGNKKTLAGTVIDFGNVEEKVGIYTATATYKGKILSFNIEVRDTTAPDIITTKVETDVYAVDTTLKLIDYVSDIKDRSKYTIDVYDGDNQIVKNNLELVTVEFVLKTAGKHEIRVVAKDQYNNSSEIKLEIEAKDNPPVIKGVSDGDTFEMTVGEETINILQDVTAEDSIDGECEVQSNFDESVDTNTPGSYEVAVSSTDKAGNKAEITVTVNVVEEQKQIAGNISSGYSGSYNSTNNYNNQSVFEGNSSWEEQFKQQGETNAKLANEVADKIRSYGWTVNSVNESSGYANGRTSEGAYVSGWGSSGSELKIYVYRAVYIDQFQYDFYYNYYNTSEYDSGFSIPVGSVFFFKCEVWSIEKYNAEKNNLSFGPGYTFTGRKMDNGVNDASNPYRMTKEYRTLEAFYYN